MKILIAHSKYTSGSVSGENRSVDDETQLLRSAGHEVYSWTPVPNVHGLQDRLMTGANCIWSFGSKAEIRRLIRDHSFDVVHFHNLFPVLSPASLRVAASDARAVVMTLRNYRLMCLPGTFLRNNQICEDCLGHSPFSGVVHGCYRGSVTASAALGASIGLHRRVGSFEKVSVFLAVSEFVLNKHVEAGIPRDRIRVQHNFAWETERRRGSGDYFVFVGRLSPEKGLDILTEAWDRSFGKLVVVGDGPDRERLSAVAPGEFEFAGGVDQKAVTELIRGARGVLVPSIWHEAFGRVAIEAYAAGVPVIASRVGGLAEIVQHEASGLLVDHQSGPSNWKLAIKRLMDDEISERLGEGAFEIWSSRYRPAIALRGLENAYSEALRLSGESSGDRG